MRLLAASPASSTQYVDDVFSTYLYTGTGAALTITNGIDLDGEGGMVWTKKRSGTDDHMIEDSENGPAFFRFSNKTNADANTGGWHSYNADGFNINTSDGSLNASGQTYASWTFRKAPRFFDLAEVTKASGSDITASFPDLETLGMVAVKRTDDAGSWYVWHRSLTAGKLLYLEQLAAEATLGHITVSGTTVTLEDGVIADGTYIVYAWAHDPLGPSGDGSDGLIACGTYTGTAASSIDIDIGWEPQYILIKSSSNAYNWHIIDNIRGIVSGGNDNFLVPNLSNAEDNRELCTLTPNGFTVHSGLSAVFANGYEYIYLAIRRPNKPPESASEVFGTTISSDDGVPGTLTDVGFPVDTVLSCARTSSIKIGVSRLTGAKYLNTTATSAEADGSVYNLSFDNMQGWFHQGFWGSSSIVEYHFKRAPGFFDVVAYTGTGAAHTESHNLTVAPELMIIKNRDQADAWAVYYGDETDYLVLNTTAATADDNTYWNDTAPTSSVFTVGTNTCVNASAEAFIAYLFATLAGISKIGTYTGNGSNQTIDMGFSAGCRFFLTKATSTTGSWTLFDSERGIISGNTPYLLLDSTAAEDTDEDAVDPDVSGIIVNETTAAINTNGVTYIYLAIA